MPSRHGYFYFYVCAVLHCEFSRYFIDNVSVTQERVCAFGNLCCGVSQRTRNCFHTATGSEQVATIDLSPQVRMQVRANPCHILYFEKIKIVFGNAYMRQVEIVFFEDFNAFCEYDACVPYPCLAACLTDAVNPVFAMYVPLLQTFHISIGNTA